MALVSAMLGLSLSFFSACEIVSSFLPQPLSNDATKARKTTPMLTALGRIGALTQQHKRTDLHIFSLPLLLKTLLLQTDETLYWTLVQYGFGPIR